MEEDLNLRPYLRALVRRGWWVLGVALLAMIASLAYSLSRPTVYEASSAILVSQQDPTAAKSFPGFAASDQVLQAVVDAYKPPAEAQIQDWSLVALATMVTAGTGPDQSTLFLHVRTSSPQVSAAIARRWAEVVIALGNEAYNNPAPDLKPLEDLAARAEKTLAAANASLADFQGRNQISALTAQLSAQQATQKDAFATQAMLSSNLRRIQGLRDRLAEQPVRRHPTGTNFLAVVLHASTAGNRLPLPASLADSLPGMSPDDQVAALDLLGATLQSQSSESAAQTDTLQAQVLELQRHLQDAQTELDNLTRQQKQAEQTYVAAARKLADERLAAQKPNHTFQLQRYARVPGAPTKGGPLPNIAAAGLLGLMLGGSVVVVNEWWKK